MTKKTIPKLPNRQLIVETKNSQVEIIPTQCFISFCYLNMKEIKATCSWWTNPAGHGSWRTEEFPPAPWAPHRTRWFFAGIKTSVLRGCFLPSQANQSHSKPAINLHSYSLQTTASYTQWNWHRTNTHKMNILKITC